MNWKKVAGFIATKIKKSWLHSPAGCLNDLEKEDPETYEQLLTTVNNGDVCRIFTIFGHISRKYKLLLEEKAALNKCPIVECNNDESIKEFTEAF